MGKGTCQQEGTGFNRYAEERAQPHTILIITHTYALNKTQYSSVQYLHLESVLLYEHRTPPQESNEKLRRNLYLHLPAEYI